MLMSLSMSLRSHLWRLMIFIYGINALTMQYYCNTIVFHIILYIFYISVNTEYAVPSYHCFNIIIVFIIVVVMISFLFFRALF